MYARFGTSARTLVVYRDESGELHLLSAHCRHLGTHIGHGARSSTIVSSVLFTACAGDPTAPTATSRISPIGPIVRCDYRCCPCASSTAACSCGISPTARIRSGTAGPLPQIPAVRDRPQRPLPALSRVLPARRERAGAPSGRRGERPRQLTLSLRTWRDGDAGLPELGGRDEEWRFLTRLADARSDDPNKMALRIHSHLSGLGFAISAFEGSSNHRLIFACTPVDDKCSNMFYSIWWPRLSGDSSEFRPTRCASRSGDNSSEPCGRTWTSGAIRSTSSALRWRRSTRNRIWPCGSG